MSEGLNVKQIKTLILFAKEQGAIKVAISPTGAIELEFDVKPDLSWIDENAEEASSNQTDEDVLYFSSQGGPK